MTTCELKPQTYKVCQDKKVLNACKPCNYGETSIAISFLCKLSETIGNTDCDVRISNIIMYLELFTNTDTCNPQQITLSAAEIISIVKNCSASMLNMLMNASILHLWHTIHKTQEHVVCALFNKTMDAIIKFKRFGFVVDVQLVLENLAAFMIKKIKKYDSANDRAETLYLYHSLLVKLGTFEEVRAKIGRDIGTVLNCLVNFMRDMHYSAIQPEHAEILMAFLLVIDKVFKQNQRCLNDGHSIEKYESLVAVLQHVKNIISNDIIVSAIDNCLFLVPF